MQLKGPDVEGTTEPAGNSIWSAVTLTDLAVILAFPSILTVKSLEPFTVISPLEFTRTSLSFSVLIVIPFSVS